MFGLGAVFGPFVVAITKSESQGNSLFGFIITDPSTTNAVTLVVTLLIISVVAYFVEIGRNRYSSHNGHHKDSSNGSAYSWRTIKISLLVCIGIICAAGAEHGFGGTLYSYLHTKKLTTEAESGMINSSFWLSFTIGRILSIFLSYHIKSSSMLIMDIAGSLASSVLFIIFSENISFIWAATIMLGFSLSSQYPTLLSFPSSHLDMKVSSIITSLFIVCGGLGSMIVPYIMLSLFKTSGPESMFYVLLCTFIVLVFVYGMLIYGFKKKESDPYLGGIISDRDFEEDDKRSK